MPLKQRKLEQAITVSQERGQHQAYLNVGDILDATYVLQWHASKAPNRLVTQLCVRDAIYHSLSISANPSSKGSYEKGEKCSSGLLQISPGEISEFQRAVQRVFPNVDMSGSIHEWAIIPIHCHQN